MENYSWDWLPVLNLKVQEEGREERLRRWHQIRKGCVGRDGHLCGVTGGLRSEPVALQSSGVMNKSNVVRKKPISPRA